MFTEFANILFLVLQISGIGLAILTRLPSFEARAIPIYRGALALLAGIILGCAGQNPQIWSTFLVTFAAMLLVGVVDFSRKSQRKTV